MRGAGTSIAGNAIGHGIVLDTSRHLNRVLSLDPEARTAPGPAGRRARRTAAAGGPRRPALRAGPVDAHPLHDRRDDRQQRLRLAGARVRPDRRQRRGADRAPRRRHRRRHRCRPGADSPTSSTSTSALVRTEFGRFGRQVSGYSFEHLLPENGRRFDRFLVRHGGHPGGRSSTPPCDWSRTPPARALAVLAYADMAEAADAVPALLARGLVACEGLGQRIVDMVPGHPDLPAGGGWLFAEVTAATRAEAERLAGEVAATAGVPHRVVSDPREQQALWRIREDGAGLAARSLTRPAQAGWEDAAVPPEKLGAYLRDFEALLPRAGTGRRSLRPLRRRLRARADRLRARGCCRSRAVPLVHRGRGRPGGDVRRFDVGRAR